jgi:ABC-type phosphonate transport system ATPase subunit
MVYHVAYDLNAPGQHYDKVIAQITQTSNRKILKSSWLVETNESPEALRLRIMAVADTNDSLFISQVINKYNGYLAQDSWDWLKERVPMG